MHYAEIASKNRKIYVKTFIHSFKKETKKYYACIVFLEKNTYLRGVILKA